MKCIITFICTFLLCQLNAQNWDKTLTDSVNVRAISPTNDGGCVILGNINSPQKVAIIKIDALGKQQWLKSFTDISTINTSVAIGKTRIVQDSDGNYWFGVVVGTNTLELVISKLDKDGNRLIYRKLPLKNAEINILNNQLIVFGIAASSNITILLRLNANGDTVKLSTIPSVTFGQTLNYASTIKSNGLLIYNTNDLLYRSQILTIGFDGTILAQKSMPNGIGFFTPYRTAQFIKAADGSYFIPDSINVIKIDSTGQFLWRKTFDINNSTIPTVFSYLMTATQDGGFMAIKNNLTRRFLDIKTFSAEGVQGSVNARFYGNTLNNTFITKSGVSGFIIVGNLNVGSVFNGLVRALKADENGYFLQYFIKGNVFSDRDNNCQLSSGDIGISRVIISAKKAGFPDIFALTDSFGRYNLNIDTGNFTVSVLKPNRYMTPCTPSVSKTIVVGKPLDSVDFALKTDFLCGLMQVDITTPRLRRCFNNDYVVNYCNNGTATAVGAYVNITIDSLMEFIGSNRPVATRTGRVYRFNLGDVPINNCGTFNLTTRVRCGDSTRLNQTLCVEAKIFPDTICVPDNTLWSGANLIVSGSCQGDSVVFQVRNGGRAASSTAASLIVENLNSTVFNVASLPVNGILTRKYPSNGNTWRMIVNQEPNHPRSMQPTAFVEGCRRAGVTNFATGFGAIFPNDDADISLDLDCQPLIGSFDPNDKIGYPIGTGATRAIAQNQDIEYMIRFQNTGTDTAFTVVVRDTIDASLDLFSIEWGASSHAYKPQIYNENVVKFTFDNILLVDSFKNEPKSNGFVKFRIKQKKDVAYGTKIQNSAGIYFDFNDPVLTNKTLHTVSKNIVTATVDKSNAGSETIKVYPNPATETLFFELEKGPLSTARFELFDMLGKRMSEQQFEGKTFQFNRQSLPSGIYLFKISAANKTIGTGKIMIQ